MSVAPLNATPDAAERLDLLDDLDQQLGELEPTGSTSQKLIVGAVVFLPLIGLIVGVTIASMHGIPVVDWVTAAVFYLVSGLGVTVGFHRLLTHRGFVPKRWLKIALAIAGSLALEGSATSWVALHRKHHVFSDRVGDPHSPNLFGDGHSAMFKGFIHAHAGWLFTADAADPERWSPDLLADPDIAKVTALVPLWTVATFAIPFFIGLAASGNLGGALQCTLWAGLVRICLLHHVTWSTNSLCHMFGRRPFNTKDRSRNFAPFALLSFGEAWHNGHHAFPSLARHGVDHRQYDISARVIAIFEGLGLVTDVRWPDRARLELRRAGYVTADDLSAAIK